MTREPIFNAPAGVVWCLGVLAAMHGLIWWVLPETSAEKLILQLAFIPARYGAAAADPLLGGWPAAAWSFLTHQLVHGDLTHLGLNSVWLLVFGSAVAVRIGGLRFLLLGLASGVAGALTFLAFRFGDPVPMIGASGAVSGLMGGAFRFFFAALDRGGFEMFRTNPKGIPLMSLRETVSDRRLQIAVAVWLAINLLSAAIAPVLTGGDGIAWQAHLGGFLFGLVAFGAFEPVRPSRPEAEAPRPTLH